MNEQTDTQSTAQRIADRRVNSGPAATGRSWWDTGADKAVHYVGKTRTVRKVTRRARSLKRGIVRWAVLITVAEVFVFVFGYGTKPGGPFGPDPATSCVTGTTVASVEGQSVAVVMARTQGDALRRLAGPPPDPRKTQQLAKRAADAVVVSILALKASARGKDEPAKVTAYNASVQQRHARQVAQNVAACTPCPTAPGLPGSTPGGGTMTVAVTGTGSDVARRAAAAAGFTGADLEVAVAVAGAESGYRPGATNRNTNGSTDYGLWQINSVHARLLASGNWADPNANARMAHQVWVTAGRSWTPWTTYTSGAYRQHQPNTVATQAISAGQTISGRGPMTCAASPTGSVAAGDATGAWGGHRNGRIPASSLCSPTFDPRVRVRCDAASSLDRLNVAYRAAFGRDLSVTDSYRDHPSQVRVKAAKGNLAATPGRSNHGWGLALDLGGGIQTFTSTQHTWMTRRAADFGWVLPSWARPGGSKPEPWHWEYVGATTATTTPGRST